LFTQGGHFFHPFLLRLDINGGYTGVYYLIFYLF